MLYPHLESHCETKVIKQHDMPQFCYSFFLNLWEILSYNNQKNNSSDMINLLPRDICILAINVQFYLRQRLLFISQSHSNIFGRFVVLIISNVLKVSSLCVLTQSFHFQGYYLVRLARPSERMSETNTTHGVFTTKFFLLINFFQKNSNQALYGATGIRDYNWNIARGTTDPGFSI